MTGIDARRLFSTANPLVSGRDVKFEEPERHNDLALASPVWNKELQSADYLNLVGELNVSGAAGRPSAAAGAGITFVSSTDPLWVPTSPMKKEYRGFIGIGDMDGSPAFYVLHAHGPQQSPTSQGKRLGPFQNLDAAITACNKQMDKKLKDYSLKPGGARSYIDSRQFDADFRRLAGQSA